MTLREKMRTTPSIRWPDMRSAIGTWVGRRMRAYGRVRAGQRARQHAQGGQAARA